MNAINPMNTINPQAMFLQQGQGSPPPEIRTRRIEELKGKLGMGWDGGEVVRDAGADFERCGKRI